MKIAITGCNGSVGRRVVILALKRGYDVVGVDLNQSSEADSERVDYDTSFVFCKEDLQDYSAVVRVLEGCEGIVHLAALPNPGDYLVNAHNSNVVMSWNVLRAAAELSITRVAQASSVNVMAMVYSKIQNVHYFPVDEDHPCLPDEPYGLSKLICELQAETIVRRFPSMRIASLRLHWSVPNRAIPAARLSPESAAKDLWAYVHEDSAADAFLLALEVTTSWSGHEAFFITAPEIAAPDMDSEQLRMQYWPNVPLKNGVEIKGRTGFFDCSKAQRLLGWVHVEP